MPRCTSGARSVTIQHISNKDAKPPQKKVGTSESKCALAADGKKKEPASPPRTPINKKKSEKQRKRQADSDEESGDGEKMESTLPVLKVHSKIMSFPFKAY